MEEELGGQPWQELAEADVAQLDEHCQLAYDMGEMAESLVHGIREEGIELDYSPDSLQLLEQVLTAMYALFRHADGGPGCSTEPFLRSTSSI